MKTTLNLDDKLVRAAKRRALEEGRPLTRLIEDAVRRYLEPARAARTKFRFEPLVRDAGPLPGVDVADRDSLYERMDGDE